MKAGAGRGYERGDWDGGRDRPARVIGNIAGASTPVAGMIREATGAMRSRAFRRAICRRRANAACGILTGLQVINRPPYLCRVRRSASPVDVLPLDRAIDLTIRAISPGLPPPARWPHLSIHLSKTGSLRAP